MADDKTIGFSTVPGDPVPAANIDFASLSDADIRDRLELVDLINRYGAGLDWRDWDLWTSIFSEDEVFFDMSDVNPEPPPRWLPIERHAAFISVMFLGMDATQHVMMNHRIGVEGDTATIVAQMRAEHWAPNPNGDPFYRMYGHYVDEAVRTDAGWRLKKVKLELIRTEGDPGVMGAALRRGRELSS